ncbi:MAG: tetratricopeptide repeat protein [Candidatus Zambryskibacteria bacterium]|nr:tetratricopeptide repeat protein [Candidatus Zambryskibacteria bacterium]
MPQIHRVSSFISIILLFLLPIFFVPGGALSLGVAKSALLILGAVLIVLVFSFEAWKEGKLNVSWHPFILLVALLPLVYLISALLSTPSSLSLLGYNFEVGTFGYMLLGSILLLLGATIFSNTLRTLQALVAFLISFSLLALFVAIKIFFGGDLLVFGNFFGNIGNPVGSWTDLAVSFGLLSVFTALAIGMVSMKAPIKILLYGVFVLSTVLLSIINFSTAFVLTLGASILLFLYFLMIEQHFSGAIRQDTEQGATSPSPTSLFSKATFLPVVLGLISIVFLINPAISETRGTLGNVVADVFGVNNADVKPSLSATLNISKAVLSQVTLFGSGPNTFSQDWLIYKPVDINATPFWSVVFPFGVGFIPTQIASTGVLGTALWLAFFVYFILIATRALNHIPGSRIKRFILISTFLIAFFLWTSSFLYTPSRTVLMLAFIFSGLFVAISQEAGVVSSKIINLKESKQTRFVSLVIILLIISATALLGWSGFEKTAAAFHFKKAVDLSNTPGTSLEKVESSLDSAVKFDPADTYYIAISRINFTKAQIAATATTSTPEENQAIFQDVLRKSINAARSAVNANPAGYQNWTWLGQIYGALVPAPLSVEGAYENSRFAYNEAFKRNPNNPELPLLLARLELNNGNPEAARSFIRNSIALKEDYADAYLMLAQLEIQKGNTTGAIASAEKLARLVPNNSGVYFELGLLKYSVKDYIGASNAFASALETSPDYANAKYYLGLSLTKLGQLEEARNHFEELYVSNPDNENLKLILEDLRAGSTSFLEELPIN